MTKTIKKQILRYGEWKHPKAPNGKLRIDKDFAKKLVDNFKKIPFAPVIRGHNETEAEKDTRLIVSKNVNGIDFDDDGINAIMDIQPEEIEKYNDVSASITMDYEDHETGQNLGPVLKHIAMVMNPYIKGLKPFVEMGESDTLIINLSDIMSKKDIKKDQVELEDTASEETASEETKAEDTETEETEEAIDQVETTDATEETEDTEEAEEATEESEEEPVEEVAEVEASEDAEALKKRVIELEEQVFKQNMINRQMEAEKKFIELSDAGKVTPAVKDIVMNLYMAKDNVVNLSDGKSTSVTELLDAMFEKLPTYVELGEQGVNTELGEIAPNLKSDLIAKWRQQNPRLSDEELQEKFTKYEGTIKASAAKYSK